ncbi:hypothetical protein J6590_050676 [Homalodisca vitripennis]|nr:hypothetical protein J6590_050676 [Homalodisca vitripennis]
MPLRDAMTELTLKLSKPLESHACDVMRFQFDKYFDVLNARGSDILALVTFTNRTIKGSRSYIDYTHSSVYHKLVQAVVRLRVAATLSVYCISSSEFDEEVTQTINRGALVHLS